MASSTANGATTTRSWKDNPKVYPPAKDIVTALQDLGKDHKKKKKGKEFHEHRYPLIDKLAADIYKAIKKEINPEGLTKNTSRGKEPLYKELVLSRKHIDATECHPFFHEYQKGGKVYLIANNPTHSGIDQAIHHFEQYVQAQLLQKNSARTGNDGLRIACILLDPQYRGSVSGIMSRKKDRTKSDIAGDPTTHFFEQILTEAFLNEEYIVSPPAAEYYDEFPEEEKGSWDPNDPAIFDPEMNRTAEWLRGTWDDYVKPKYKASLDLWNKGTGGGDGGPTNFVNYCKQSDRWLVYLFCKDLEANFLLAHSAGGRMPAGLQVESGFEEEVSSVSGSDKSPSLIGSKRGREIESELAEAKQHRKEIGNNLAEVISLMKSRSNNTNSSAAKSPTIDDHIRKVADYSKMMQDASTLDTMSPDTKAAWVSTLKQERKAVMEKLSSHPEN
jgi:hypothetical protein